MISVELLLLLVGIMRGGTAKECGRTLKGKGGGGGEGSGGRAAVAMAAVGISTRLRVVLVKTRKNYTVASPVLGGPECVRAL